MTVPDSPHKKFKIRAGTKFDIIGTQNRIEISHQEAKLRIFRVFACIFVAVVILSAITAVIRYIGAENTRKQLYRDLSAQLAAMEQTGTETQYDKDRLAVRLITFREEQLMPLASAEEARKLKEQNTEARTQFEARRQPPEVPQDAFQNGNFVCPTAFLDMAFIPAGSFRMGGTSDNEMPAHDVTLTHPFWMARTETTNRQMHVLIPGFDAGIWNGYRLNLPGQPAVRVRWDQAVMYCRKLTETERIAGRLPSGYVYRLPTEAEWEYACRAGGKTDYHWGTDFGQEGAQYANVLDKKAAERYGWQLKPIADAPDTDSYLVTAPAASFLPNRFGLYDMEGNAAEWCEDWYNAQAYSAKAVTDPYQKEPVNTAYTRFRNYDAGTWTTETVCRVLRGGSWGVEPKKARCAYRDFMPPNEANTGAGFRIVLAKELP